ncbi:MAG: hypothetical protein WC554_01000 [Clostridia bacterium]
MKIGLCVPNYNDDCKFMFAISLWKTKFPEGAEVRLSASTAQWACNALTMIVTEYRKWEADYFVILSNDIAWNPSDIMKLINHNLPIVGGWASGRCHPFMCHVCDYYDPDKDAFRPVKNEDAIKKTGVEKIAANGGEMVIIRKDVFDKIPYPWFFGPEMIGKDRMSTEDYFFAKQAIKYGVDMYVDWDVPVKHSVNGMRTFKGSLIA